MRKLTLIAVSVFVFGALAAAQISKPVGQAPRTEFTLGVSLLDADTSGISAYSGGSINRTNDLMKGFNFEFAHYMKSRLGYVFDYNRSSDGSVDTTGIKFKRISYMAGPAYRLKENGVFTIAVHGLGGYGSGLFRDPIQGAANQYFDYHTSGVAAAGGVTVDAGLSPHVAIRLAGLDGVYTNEYNAHQFSLRYVGGVVIRF